MHDPLTYDEIPENKAISYPSRILIAFNVIAVVGILALLCFWTDNYDQEFQKMNDLNSQALPNDDTSQFLLQKEAFEQFMLKYEKYYPSTEERERRFGIFKEHYDNIARHNSSPFRTSTLAVNNFADLTKSELLEVRAGPKAAKKRYRLKTLATFEELPTVVDWVAEGKVTAVKDQGECGSCWAITASGAIESAYAIQSDTLLSLSSQQLLDCFGHDHGCDGSIVNGAFYYAQNFGLMAEEDYPYEGKKGACNHRKSKALINVLGYTDLAPFDNDQLQLAVVQQPVTVELDSLADEFLFYDGGIITSSNCGSNTNHAALITGYGTDENSGIEFWVVKNSWGEDWGENGFARIKRDKGLSAGVCGIATKASFPTVE